MSLVFARELHEALLDGNERWLADYGVHLLQQGTITASWENGVLHVLWPGVTDMTYDYDYGWEVKGPQASALRSTR